MRKIDNLKEVLENHKKYLNDEEDGERADLSYADLSYADLSYADLSCADLSCADLSYADLSCADLSYADLSYADLRSADLRSANLRSADLSDIKYNVRTAFFALSCPEEGSFIGFKKCKDDRIVKLKILEDSKRSSATSRKCRASKVKVLEITNIENTEKYEEATSKRDEYFIYRVGETIEINDFDKNRWNECSTGIHFFITRDEAVKYNE